MESFLSSSLFFAVFSKSFLIFKRIKSEKLNALMAIKEYYILLFIGQLSLVQEGGSFLVRY